MHHPLRLSIDRILTPLGELLLVTDESGYIRAIDWNDYETRMLRLLQLHYGRHGFHLEPAQGPHDARKLMERYFAGEVNAIENVPVKTAGTPFQRSVWNELRRIPSGEFISYRKLAAQIARPKAVRAVGLANGANPIGIVVPCHRVIGSDGSLTGYGGGLDRKRWLLDHERTHAAGRAPAAF
jgi:methylated-DNA-[protein]-cysteine S-methyltransferase